MIYWLTGQPGHGKTVQATLLLSYINEGVPFFRRALHIDGDHLRDLVHNKDYSRQGRENNIRLAQTIAKYLHNNNFDVVVSLVAPYREIREEFKTEMGSDLVEIFVESTEIRGRENFHTEYEKPLDNFVYLNTDNEDPERTHIRLVDMIDDFTGAI